MSYGFLILKNGCDKIIVITTKECDYRKTKERGALLSSLIYRKYPNLVKLLKERVKGYNESREILNKLEEEGKIFLISPSNTASWGRTDRDPKKFVQCMKLGIKLQKNYYQN